MQHHGLEPHTLMSQWPHPRHKAWLSQFSSRQRHGLIDEDYRARMHVFGILLSAALFGLSMLLVVLLLAR